MLRSAEVKLVFHRFVNDLFEEPKKRREFWLFFFLFFLLLVAPIRGVGPAKRLGRMNSLCVGSFSVGAPHVGTERRTDPSARTDRARIFLVGERPRGAEAEQVNRGKLQ